MSPLNESLGLPPTASYDQIQQAYAERLSYWREQKRNPARADEAARAVDQLCALWEEYEMVRAAAQGPAGLSAPAPRAWSASPPGAPTGTLPGAGMGMSMSAAVGATACPQCGFAHNPPDAMHCGGCGAPLAEICPNCHRRVPYGQAFCNYCRASLEESRRQQAEAEAAAQRAAELRAEEERSQKIEAEKEERRIGQILEEWPGRLRAHLATLPPQERGPFLERVADYRTKHNVSKPLWAQPWLKFVLVLLSTFPPIAVVTGPLFVFSTWRDPESAGVTRGCAFGIILWLGAALLFTIGASILRLAGLLPPLTW